MVMLTADARGTAKTAFFPPPSGGWNTRDPVAGMKPEFAPIFDNLIVESGAPRVRRGWRVWSTGLPGRVDGLLPFNGAGSTAALFAASGTGIYNVTAGGAVGAAVVTGLTSARWDGVNFAASGGNFLFAWNGADTERTYDGTTWATWGATGITGRVGWAMSFKGRLFVGNPARLSFFYGGAGAIAGAFTEFPLQGVARRGGSVVAACTLSVDNGDGPDDMALFITSEGEVIVYAGTDPSSATAWGLVGRWTVPRPIGSPHRCVVQWGGDVAYLSDGGVVPLAAFRTQEEGAQAMQRHAITRRIQPTWLSLANDRRSLSGWGLCALSRLASLVINVPWSSTGAQQIVRTENEALSRWGGVPAAVWCEALGGRVFFGDSTAGGRVCLYGEDITDDGDGIRSQALLSFGVMGSPARVKRIQQMQPVFRDGLGATVDLQVPTDWAVPVPQMDSLGPTAAAPSVPPYPGGTSILVWDVGLWDVGLWAGEETDVVLPWRGVRGMGYAVAPLVTLVSGNGRPSLLGVNAIADTGGTLR